MHWTQVLLISVVAAVLVVGASHIFWRAAWTPAFAHALSSRDGASGWHRGGWRHGHQREEGGFAHFCDADSRAWIDDIAVVVERRLDIRPEQKAAWDNLVAAVRTGSDAVAGACPGAADDVANDTAAARLARMEALLGAGAAAVGRVRPAFDAFYAALSDDQRTTLDELTARRHRH